MGLVQRGKEGTAGGQGSQYTNLYDPRRQHQRGRQNNAKTYRRVALTQTYVGNNVGVRKALKRAGFILSALAARELDRHGLLVIHAAKHC